MKKRVLAILLALAMVAVLLPVAALADDTKGFTASNPFTSVEEYRNAIGTNSTGWNSSYATYSGKNVYLTINGQNFTSANLFNLPNVQSWENPPKLHLTITNCTFTGNTAGDPSNFSFMYLPNCQSLVIDNCTFNAGTSGLVYGINWNLCGIQGATVSVTNSTFTGSFTKNALKLNQRNGTDDAATDVDPSYAGGASISGAETPATIASATIENCTFSGNNAVIQLGSAGKGAGNTAAPSTGAFPVTISNVSDGLGGPVTVELAYLEASDTVSQANKVSLPAGYTFSKSASTAAGAYSVSKPTSEPVRADLVITRQADGTSTPVQVQVTLGRKLTGSYGGYYFDHGVGVLTMQPGQSLYIHDLPANMSYEIAVLDGLVTSEHNIAGTTLPGVYTYVNFAALPGVTTPDVVPGEEEIIEGEEELVTPGEEEGDVQEGTEETVPEEGEVPEEGLEELPEEGETPAEEEPVDVPKTGDAMPSIGLALVLGLAACAVVWNKARAK